MRLSEELDAIKAHADGVEQIVKSFRERLRHARDSWPDHQIIPCFDWHDRDETPPAGKLWASDGTSVWLINNDGKPISKEASAVLYWTVAYLPAPPDFERKATRQSEMHEWRPGCGHSRVVRCSDTRDVFCTDCMEWRPGPQSSPQSEGNG